MALRPTAIKSFRGDRTPHGFTMLELLIAMSIFTVLGTMAIYFMRNSLDIFNQGTSELAKLDRADIVLPKIVDDLAGLYIGDDWDPPTPPPEEDALLNAGMSKPPPPPPNAIRFRSGFVKLTDGVFKDYPCPYFAFIQATGSEWRDASLRRSGETIDEKALDYTPTTREKSDGSTQFKPMGGLMEVCYIAIPQSESQSSLLTLYRGFRAPIGSPSGSLLDPANLDTTDKVKAACRPIARDLVHFGALWRRSFSTSWDRFQGGTGSETDPYVGEVWDSTRGLDPKWQFFRGKDSASDNSDDIFPAFVRLEVTLQGTGLFGQGRGETRTLDVLNTEDRELRVHDVDFLIRPGPDKIRYLKIGSEWMRYHVDDVEYQAKKVRVHRAQRGTSKFLHKEGSWIYIGNPFTRDMRLPVTRDRFVVKKQ